MNIRVTPTADAEPSLARLRREGAAEIPAYLEKVYWWTYVRPWAIRVFERQWLINAIVFGNYARLRDKALDLLGPAQLSGRTLQIACAYGDLTNCLAARVQAGEGLLDVVDVVPGQIQNMRRKLPPDAPVRGLVMDSADLDLPDGRYDRAVLFLLLHEQPEDWRRKTLSEGLAGRAPGRTNHHRRLRPSEMVEPLPLHHAASARAPRAFRARLLARRSSDVPAPSARSRADPRDGVRRPLSGGRHRALKNRFRRSTAWPALALAEAGSSSRRRRREDGNPNRDGLDRCGDGRGARRTRREGHLAERRSTSHQEGPQRDA